MHDWEKMARFVCPRVEKALRASLVVLVAGGRGRLWGVLRL